MILKVWIFTCNAACISMYIAFVRGDIMGAMQDFDIFKYVRVDFHNVERCGFFKVLFEEFSSKCFFLSLLVLRTWQYALLEVL